MAAILAAGPAILSAVSLIKGALDVVAEFKGDAKVAKATGYVQDAVSVVSALTPLVTQWGAGVEVTPEDVKAALAGKDAALAEFDRLIAEKSAAASGT